MKRIIASIVCVLFSVSAQSQSQQLFSDKLIGLDSMKKDGVLFIYHNNLQEKDSLRLILFELKSSSLKIDRKGVVTIEGADSLFQDLKVFLLQQQREKEMYRKTAEIYKACLDSSNLVPAVERVNEMSYKKRQVKKQ